MGNDGGGVIKVATEKATKRTIIETVNASGKIYPEIEVKISPDISGQITELNVQEGDTVKKARCWPAYYADIYSLQKQDAAAQSKPIGSIVANREASIEALKARLDQSKQTLTGTKNYLIRK